jgi:hypothetical protein
MISKIKADNAAGGNMLLVNLACCETNKRLGSHFKQHNRSFS